jgi:sugar lactone lactonase YvrE
MRNRNVTLLAAIALAFPSKLVADNGTITTIAGGGAGGLGNPATSAALSSPEGMALDAAGNLYIAEPNNKRVLRVDAGTGIITLFAGSGGPAPGGDGGPATLASFAFPAAVAVDNVGNVYISDLNDNRVRRVDGQTGIITTVAGTGAASSTGDGGLATAASVWSPAGMAFDQFNNLYIADELGGRIRRVDANTAIISTVAGAGASFPLGDGGPATAAALYYPVALAFDHAGNLYISDSYNCRIRRVDATTGIITMRPLRFT